ncbi:MAG: malate dehydrogenase [Chitinispirillales bacterium]|jgi:malate dehydrogenase|nr:malate dehydrogenase [Chitinispirillales bacterium]
MQAKVAVIGCGNVGGAAGLALAAVEGIELVLIEEPGRENIAKAKAADIFQASCAQGIDVQVVGTSDWSAINGADICIVTAGRPRSPGMSRDDLLEANVRIIRSISYRIKNHAPGSFVFVVTNPLDIMAHQLFLHTGFPPYRIIGMSGHLDAARFRALVSSRLGCSVREIQAMILGSHGDTMVPVLSHCFVGGIPINLLMGSSQIRRIVHETRHGGGQIVSLMGTSGYFAAGACISEMVRAVLFDRKSHFCASVYAQGEYGLHGLFLGMPVVVGRSGVERIVELKLDDKEKAWLQRSASQLRILSERACSIL